MSIKILMNADGGGAAGGSAGAPPASGGTPPPAAAAPWYGGFADDVKGYVEAKGFKDPQSVVEAYRNAEKLIGAPPESTVRIPKRDDDPAWKDIHGKMGRPEKAEGYNINMGEGQEEFTKFTRELFHELGLSKKQGESIATKWLERLDGFTKKAQETAQITAKNQEKELQSEWGAAYEQKTRNVGQLVKAAGMTAEQLDQVEAVLGVDGAMKLFDKIIENHGIKFGEPPFRSGDSTGANAFGPMTPGAAQARRDALFADSEWVQRFSQGGAREREEFNHVEEMIWKGKQNVG